MSWTIRYEIPRYAQPCGEEFMILRLPGVDYDAYEVGRDGREFPLRLDNRDLSRTVARLKLPEGLELYTLNRPVKAVSALLDYEASFAREGRDLVFKDSYLVKATAAPAKEYAGYKRAVEAMARLAQGWIVLKRSK